jgi:uncharacterized membrane protein YsdA (DUF1294 family)
MNDKHYSLMALLITTLGALGCGGDLAVGQIFFPDQKGNFFECPLWYQLVFFASMGVIVAGLLLSGKFRKANNTSLFELVPEITLIVMGLIGSSFALINGKNILKDVMVVIGFVSFVTGLSTLVSTLIGILSNKRIALERKIFGDRLYNNDKKISRLASTTILVDLFIFTVGVLTDVFYLAILN